MADYSPSQSVPSSSTHLASLRSDGAPEVNAVAYLEALLDDSVDMIVVTDAEGSIVWTNTTVLRVMGHAPSDVVGKPILDFVHPDEVVVIADSMRSTMGRAGGADPIEVRIATIDGGWKYCEVVGNNRLADPQVGGVVWHARDVTGRLEAQRRFRRLFESNPLPTALIRTSFDGAIANDAFAALVGYSREELLYLDTRLLASPRSAAKSVERGREILTGPERSSRHDARLCRKDGSEFIADVSMSITDEADGSIAVLLTINDVTEWRDAVRAAGRSEARLEAILDHSSDIIVLVQADGYWTANQAATRLLGYPKGFDPPEGVLHMVDPRDREGAWAAVLQLINGERDPEEPFLVRLTDVKGNVRWHECRARAIAGLGAAVVTARDLTAERANTALLLERERELATAVAARERAELETRVEQAMRLESVGRLAAGLAHDFNNLVSVILNYTAVLGHNQSLDSPARSDLESVATAAKQAATLANSLLQFGEVSSEEFAVVDLNDVVATLEPLLSGSMRDQQVCSFARHSEAASVQINRGQVEQVVMNLVLNGRDAMSRSGRIVVGVVVDGDGAARTVTLSVSDDGAGMTDDVMKRAFDPFFTTKATGTGSGLGLAVVHGIVEQSGGAIRIDSERGRGTIVTVRWPYQPMAQDTPLA